MQSSCTSGNDFQPQRWQVGWSCTCVWGSRLEVWAYWLPQGSHQGCTKGFYKLNNSSAPSINCAFRYIISIFFFFVCRWTNQLVQMFFFFHCLKDHHLWWESCWLENRPSIDPCQHVRMQLSLKDKMIGSTSQKIVKIILFGPPNWAALTPNASGSIPLYEIISKRKRIYSVTKNDYKCGKNIMMQNFCGPEISYHEKVGFEDNF